MRAWPAATRRLQRRPKFGPMRKRALPNLRNTVAKSRHTGRTCERLSIYREQLFSSSCALIVGSHIPRSIAISDDGPSPLHV